MVVTSRLCLVAALFTSTSAVAQLMPTTTVTAVGSQERAAAPQSGPQPEGLGEIVVTAQRRAERLQDVPISVTAITADTLATANVRSLQDLSATIPGFVATSSAGYGGRRSVFEVSAARTAVETSLLMSR